MTQSVDAALACWSHRVEAAFAVTYETTAVGMPPAVEKFIAALVEFRGDRGPEPKRSGRPFVGGKDDN